MANVDKVLEIVKLVIGAINKVVAVITRKKTKKNEHSE